MAQLYTAGHGAGSCAQSADVVTQEVRGRWRVHIRSASDDDLERVLAVERAAFGTDAEADLVRALLADPSAQPVLSLIALRGERALGHILFSRAGLEPRVPWSAALLAPLAVAPSAQRQGIGGRLIAAGLSGLAAGVDLVFVLGHPEYYNRHGFRPAGVLGFTAPYPIPPEHADAWMVQELRPGVIGACQGSVICARALDRPEYWRE